LAQWELHLPKAAWFLAFFPTLEINPKKPLDPVVNYRVYGVRTMRDESFQKIGQAAKAAAVGVETVRFYEREGLLPKPKRSAAGYRLYPPDTVKRLQFIKQAKQLGFTLSEINELLSLRASSRANCGHVRARAERKRDEIDGKLRELRRVRRALNNLIEECTGEGPLSGCTILGAMDGK
jgi:MerR family mercuric resistance operon transcriptional regulator